MGGLDLLILYRPIDFYIFTNQIVSVMEKEVRFLLIDTALRVAENRELLHDFDTTIFKPSFPFDAEREDLLKDIVPRIEQPNDVPSTMIVLAVRNRNGEDGGDSDHEVVGGIVFDWYEQCKSLEIIYIAVLEGERMNGLGSRLLMEGTAEITRRIPDVKRVYFETENPDKEQVENSLSVMDPYDRLCFFGKHRAAVLVENYYQPPLSPGKPWAENMMLCVLPVFKYGEGDAIASFEDQDSIPIDEAMSFLECFYDGLAHAQETPEGKSALDMMRKEMEQSCLDQANVVALTRIEGSWFKFPYATVAAHYSIDPSVNSKKEDCRFDFGERDSVFNSYECDLMRYGLQEYERRPIVTHHFQLWEKVPIQLPSWYKYYSEGKTFRVRQWKERRINVNMSFNWSYHRFSGKYIATLVVCPSEGSFFTESDLLKFISLMGFGSKQERVTMEEQMKDVLPEDKSIQLNEKTLEKLIKKAFGLEGDPIHLGTGITELDLLDMKGTDPEVLFNRLKSDLHTRLFSEDIWNKTLCGIILGIFDYMRMNEGEIADTINPLKEGNSFFIQMCRGNLVQVRYDLSDERIDKILTSAYLIIPSVLLAFNEKELRDDGEIVQSLKVSKEDKQINAKIKEEHKLKFVHWPITDFERYLYLSRKIKEIETNLDENYCRGVFQYESEQLIMKGGNDQRGLEDSYNKLKESVILLKNRSKEYRSKYTGRIDTLQNLILLLLAILQVATIESVSKINTFGWVMLSLMLVIGVYLYFKRFK